MRFTNKLLVSLSLAASLAISSGATTSKNETTSNISKNLTFLESYSNIAFDNYTDALKDAKNLKVSIDKFVALPLFYLNFYLFLYLLIFLKEPLYKVQHYL